MSNEIVTGLDVGGTKICVVVGRIIPDKRNPEIVGYSSVPSNGLRKGVVVDIEETVSAISAALEEAERMAGVPVDNAVVGVESATIQSQNSKGVIAVSRSDGEISPDDVVRVLEAARAVSVPANREILHVIPRSYKVDDQVGIHDPLGMTGVRLEVEAHVITASTPTIKNLTKCIYQAGLDIDEMVLGVLASSKAVLARNQKEVGVVVVDIGYSTTGVAVFEEGNVLYTSVLPVGASHVTNDIAIGLRTSIDVAEKVKLEEGCAVPAVIPERERIDLKKYGVGDGYYVSRREVAEIIEARMLEIFGMVNDELKKVGRDGMLPAGVVLTGGGSKLVGVIDLAKEAMRLPSQIGLPVNVSGMVDKLSDDPRMVAAVGLMEWASDVILKGSEVIGGSVKKESGDFGLAKIKDWFGQFLP
ncbi:cell division protein FtsA [Patescibacteria group bacterium]|nr:cell division protein FtsA [Patescibacteria group bacterium]